MRYVLRADRKRQHDRMDFKSSPSLVSSKNRCVRVHSGLRKRFGVADGWTDQSKKKGAAACAEPVRPRRSVRWKSILSLTASRF